MIEDPTTYPWPKPQDTTLDKREYIACMAMAGILASGKLPPDKVAVAAVGVADQLINELECNNE